MTNFLELVLAGLTRGSIYALVALGYTVVYGILGLINFAHGEVYMIAAFIALLTAGALGILGFNDWAIFAITLAVAVSYAAAYGYTIEKIAYKPLRHAPRLSALISAIGMSIFLQNFVLLGQGAEFRAFPNLIDNMLGITPGDYFDEEVAASPVQPTEWAILLAAFFSMVTLVVIIKLTKIGQAMQAVSQDRKMALLLGINLDRIIAVAFILGSSFAALGGVLVAAHVGQINFYFGFIIGIKAFTAAVLGGIGSLSGAFVGGILLGLIESFTTGYLRSDFEDIVAFLILVVILIFRPRGLLGKSYQEKHG